jgi:hypothetical protein
MTKIEGAKVESLNKERMTCVIHLVQMSPHTFKIKEIKLKHIGSALGFF